MEYRGYRIKRGPFGWFAAPIDMAAHINEERYGYSVNMDSKLAVECWIDDRTAQLEKKKKKEHPPRMSRGQKGKNYVQV